MGFKVRSVMSLHARWFLVLVFAALASSGLQAAKPGGGGSTPPAGSACAGAAGFPAMAYSRGVYSKSGSYLKTQIFVADSLGTCEVMVYDTGDYSGPDVETSFHFDDGTGWGTLAWSQTRDNGENASNGRAVVKVARFQVNAAGAVVGLPVASTTVYRASLTPFSVMDVELSRNGKRLAFSTQNRVSVNGVLDWLNRVLICDLPACTGLDQAFAATSAGGTFKLAIAGDAADGSERIYFGYRPGAPWSDGDLVAIDHTSSGWTPAPNIIVNRDLYIGDSDTTLSDPSVLSVPGEPDRILLWTRASANAGVPRVDVVDVDVDGMGTNVLTRFVGTGYRPTWTVGPSSHSPNILVSQLPPSQTSAIDEIDLNACDSDGSNCSQATLPNVRGFAVDSAR
jgi:hypothetical protein